MRLKELRKLPECPEWLKHKDIKVSREDIEIVDGNVVWNVGVWEKGRWEKGKWKDGIWYDGTWCDGTWYDGIWCDGTWYDGIWWDGFWEKGLWKGGSWKGGTWIDGWKEYGFCKWSCSYRKGTREIKIGCIRKKIKEWEEWFVGSEEFETKRSDHQFDLIEKAFKMGRALIEIEIK